MTLRIRDTDLNLCKGAILCADRVLTATSSKAADISSAYCRELQCRRLNLEPTEGSSNLLVLGCWLNSGGKMF